MGEKRGYTLSAFLLVIFVNAGEGVKESYPVITAPVSIQNKGQTGTIPCSYERDVFDVVWKKGDSPSTAQTLVILDVYYGGLRSGRGYEEGLFDIQDDYTLVINDVKQEDEGRYYCEVSDRDTGVVFRNHSDVTVIDIEKSLGVFMEEVSIVYWRMAATLTCRYERDVYAVYWRKGDSYSNAQTLVILDMIYNLGEKSGEGYEEGRFDITDDYSLIINDVWLEDEGRYYCEVSDHGKGILIRNHTDVTVVAMASKPFIVQCHISESELLTASDSCAPYDDRHRTSAFTLVCSVNGFKPNISLYWDSSGRVLHPLKSSQHMLADGTFERNITLLVDTNEVSGEKFICTAEGLAVNGTVSSSITIDVPKDKENSSGWKAALAIGILVIIIILIVFLCLRRRQNRLKMRKASQSPLLEHTDKNELIEFARLSQKEGNYGEMARAMHTVAETNCSLSSEERNLLEDAYRQEVEERLIILKYIPLNIYDETDRRTHSMERGKEITDNLKERLEAEIEGNCNKVLELLKYFLIKPLPQQATEAVIDNHVSYLRMKGDFYQYMSRIKSGNKQTTLKKNSEAAYKEALELATRMLSLTHPTTLGIFLILVKLDGNNQLDESAVINLNQSVKGTTQSSSDC